MAKTVIDDKARIENMIANIDYCINKINSIKYDDFADNIDIRYAISMAVQIVCESAIHITNETKNEYKEIEWKEMSTIRNIISHEYGALNLEIIFNTIKDDFPNLKSKLEKVLEKMK
ncbi:MAG: DUF86 domain-containing protein [Lachnospiraceae bacterium]|nr:DUF86 domain-containing protein [Lachnospiraceae bacterium]